MAKKKTSTNSTESFYSYSAKRKLRKEEVAAYRRIVIATVAVIALLVAGYYVGVPLIARMGGDDADMALNKLGQRDTIPPTPPRLDSLPEATRTPEIQVKGTAESSSTVRIFIDDQEVLSLIVDRDGIFQGDLTLKEGLNTITATATDSADNTSRATQPLMVLLKTTQPQLSLSREIDSRTTEESVTVAGRTEAGAKVTINEASVFLNDDNSFDYTVRLEEGSNTIRVVATDRAGNTRQLVRTVTREVESEVEDEDDEEEGRSSARPR